MYGEVIEIIKLCVEVLGYLRFEFEVPRPQHSFKEVKNMNFTVVVDFRVQDERKVHMTDFKCAITLFLGQIRCTRRQFGNF